MSSKEVLFGDEARHKLQSGIDQMADVVKPSFGPNGKSLRFDEKLSSPKIGEGTLLKDFSIENLGICLVKQEAQKLHEEIGDGTTSFLILVQKMLEESFLKGSLEDNSIQIVKSLEDACQKCLKELDNLRLPVKTKKQMTSIASANSSACPLISKMVVEAFRKTGNNGQVYLEEASGCQTYISISDGIKVSGGLFSPYFLTNKDKNIAEYNEPRIAIFDQKIHSALQLLPLLKSFIGNKHPLVIVTKEISSDALSSLSLNHQNNIIRVCPIKMIDGEKEDLAKFTGARIISKGTTLTSDPLGSCEKFIANSQSATFIGNTREKDKYEQIATIRIGAYSEQELIYKFQAFKSTLQTMQTALNEGITLGSGTAYYNVAKKLSNRMIGEDILKSALKSIAEQIIKNAGCIPPAIFHTIDSKPLSWGFNARSEKVEDLVKANIFDSVKTLKNTLRHAVSLVKTLLLTQTVITDKRED